MINTARTQQVHSYPHSSDSLGVLLICPSLEHVNRGDKWRQNGQERRSPAFLEEALPGAVPLMPAGKLEPCRSLISLPASSPKLMPEVCSRGKATAMVKVTGKIHEAHLCQCRSQADTGTCGFSEGGARAPERLVP